jgi:large subunit ribosomal protein L29
MKAAELRQSSAEDLQNRLDELVEESFNLRFQHVVGQLSSAIRLRQVRRDIARLRTVLRENELGVRELASKETGGTAG